MALNQKLQDLQVVLVRQVLSPRRRVLQARILFLQDRQVERDRLALQE